MVKNLIFILFGLLALNFLFFPFVGTSDGEKLSGAPSPEIYLSSQILEQGEVLFVKIKNSSAKNGKIKNINGKLGTRKVGFFKIPGNDDWFGLAAIDAKRKPGKYDLIISFGKKNLSEKITVVKKEFPLTKLVTTKELQKQGYNPATIVKQVVQNNALLNEILLIFSPNIYFDQAFEYPLSKIKSVGDFGNIRQNKYGAVQHLGVDLLATSDTPVFAANSGIVRISANLGSSGKTIVIDHGLGIFSLYLHLNKMNVQVGKKVKKGDLIALSGNTGYSIIPHLHFSIKVLGSSVDPLKFIELTRKELKP